MKSKLVPAFKEWYEFVMGEEFDINDIATYKMGLAFQAGYHHYSLKLAQLQKQPLRSPIKEKQTPESAAEIGRQLQEDLSILRGEDPDGGH